MTETERHNLIDQLRSLRDEIRVRLHLAGMDARDAWKTLEPKARQLEHDLELTGRQITSQIRESFESIRASLEKMRDEMTSKPPPEDTTPKAPR
jgi:hypothetical protein